MRQKALQFLGKLDGPSKENYGFNSRRCPPSVNELTDFEDDMTNLIKIIEYRNMNSKFQSMLSSDIRKIAADNYVFVPAEKSRNNSRCLEKSTIW